MSELSNLSKKINKKNITVTQTQRFNLNGAQCTSSVFKIEKAIKAVPGVQDAVVNVVEKEVEVSWFHAPGTSADHVISAIRHAGCFDASKQDPKCYDHCSSNADIETFTFEVPNMDSEHCANLVTKKLEAFPSVDSVSTNLNNKTVQVEGSASEEELRLFLSDIGYPASGFEPSQSMFVFEVPNMGSEHCASLVTKKLEALPSVDSVTTNLSKKTLLVEGSASEDELRLFLSNIGYPATGAEPTKSMFTFELPNMGSEHCASRVTKKLEELPSVESVVANPESKTAIVTGTASKEDLLAHLSEIGYPAAGDQRSSPEVHKNSNTHNNSPAITFDIDNITCASCIAKIEKALNQVPGVVSAVANLAEKSATVRGNASEAALLKALYDIGYPGTVVTDSSAQMTFDIENITCASCIAKVEKALNSVPGVKNAVANLAEKSATVTGSASVSALLQALSDIGYPGKMVGASLSEVIYEIDNILCASCVPKVEKVLRTLPDITSVVVSLEEKTATIKGSASAADIMKALANAGYPGRKVTADEQREKKKAAAEHKEYKSLMRGAAIALSLGVPLMIIDLIGYSSVNSPAEQWFWGIIDILVLGILIGPGGHFYTSAWNNLKHRTANMDTLIAMGVGTAWLYSTFVILFPHLFPESGRYVYLEAAAFIVGLINLGHGLGIRARGKTSEAVKKLIGLQPKTARVIRDGGEFDLPIEDVKEGDLIRLRPGDKVSVDGRVVEGSSTVDESMLTGEPLPIKKEVDSQLAAGTINKNGSLVFVAEKVGADTALANIIRLVKSAQNTKLPIGQLVDKISSVFVPFVIVTAIISGLIWYFVGPSPAVTHGLIIFTTVVIIACPCALGLATPLSIITGVGKAAELGLLVRNGEALQKASKLDVIIVDKTGTVTEGKPSVTDIVAVNNYKQDDILRLAASLEQSSEHPLAEAIVESAKNKQLELTQGSDFEAISGFGILGTIDNHKLALGNQKLMDQESVDTKLVAKQLDAFAEQGKTPMYLSIDGKLAGIIVVADAIREDSADAIRRLQKMGVKVIRVWFF